MVAPEDDASPARVGEDPAKDLLDVPVKPRTLPSTAFAAWPSKASAVACGFVFGFVLHKAGVYTAGVIIRQLALTEFLMLKVCWRRRVPLLPQGSPTIVFSVPVRACTEALSCGG